MCIHPSCPSGTPSFGPVPQGQVPAVCQPGRQPPRGAQPGAGPGTARAIPEPHRGRAAQTCQEVCAFTLTVCAHRTLKRLSTPLPALPYALVHGKPTNQPPFNAACSVQGRVACVLPHRKPLQIHHAAGEVLTVSEVLRQPTLLHAQNAVQQAALTTDAGPSLWARSSSTACTTNAPYWWRMTCSLPPISSRSSRRPPRSWTRCRPHPVVTVCPWHDWHSPDQQSPDSPRTGCASTTGQVAVVRVLVE